MRISDWSSDVCSSDLRPDPPRGLLHRQPVQLVQTFQAVGMRIFLVADDEVGIAAHLFREMTVQIQLDADRHAWPDDSAYAFDQITLAIVISLRNHGAMQIELHGVDRQRHLEIRSEEHTSELQSLMRISYAVFCLKKKKNT